MNKYTLPLLLILLFSGCVTTNYYTGRTLEEGKTVLTPGVDNLILIEQDEGIVEKKMSFSISFGVAHGLPWRFETGIRGYFPYIYEVNLRHQINPRDFEWFDISFNGHMGFVFSDRFADISPPYFKYGLTISKEIATLQPYFGWYLNNNFSFRTYSDEISDYTIFCFGLAIPFHGDLIMPECNYLQGPDSGPGVYSIGIGLRASLDKKLK